MDDVLRDRVVELAQKLGAQDDLGEAKMDAAADQLLAITTDREILSSAHGLLMGMHASRGGVYLLQAWMLVERALKKSSGK